VVVAGVTSGVGKTTIAMAIMRALYRDKGLRVQPFKVGPDFIDPSYHSLVTGGRRQSRNLDVWMMGRQGVLECFAAATADVDVAVIEGVMGLYDGMSGKDGYASTAHVARILRAPVILVVDAGRAARSIAAIVLGFMRFDRGIRIAGVILNNVAGDRHASYVRDALAPLKVPIVGMVARNSKTRMEERHLGLVPAQELQRGRRNALVRSAREAAEQIDIDMVLKICDSSANPAGARASVIQGSGGGGDAAQARESRGRQAAKVRIAVALDESFNFYYADNLDALRRHGAELVFFSPVNDSRLPEGADGLVLGGGFPEVLADKLGRNNSMMASVAKAVNDGMPVYGECGGLMYLTRSISGYRGQRRATRMIGAVDADTVMTSRLTLNYTEALCDGPLFGRSRLRGHEFHYSAIQDIAADSRFAYTMKKGRGVADGRDGFILNNGLAAYMHLHFGANDRLPAGLVRSCARYSRR
jgi:cobyrinic acid a,c-diamide synthase